MRSKKLVLGKLKYQQLTRVASRFGLKFSGKKKEELIAVISRSHRCSLGKVLQSLTCLELRTIGKELGITNLNHPKEALVTHIKDDKLGIFRLRILGSLRAQGFQIVDDRIEIPNSSAKDQLRKIHLQAVSHKRQLAFRTFGRKEESLLSWIANGSEVDPTLIRPELVEVLPRSIEEQVFRYVCLHWSIPVSCGYGRRIRYLVMDASNRKLIGLIGLGDPVFALRPRDYWIGWNTDQRKAGLHHVLDAFVLGAVPPYSNLLCGKLVAMLASSTEVTSRFRCKYGGRKSLISQKRRNGEVALITTTSALGRSSIYNRLKFKSDPMFVSVGFTQGSGDFQFLNGLYDEMSEYAINKLTPSAKNLQWGTGFRNRREVVGKFIDAIGLNRQLLYHGVKREIFLVPTASNTSDFLCGRTETLNLYQRSMNDIFEWFKARWLLPRSSRDSKFLDFENSSYAIWNRQKLNAEAVLQLKEYPH